MKSRKKFREILDSILGKFPGAFEHFERNSAEILREFGRNFQGIY